MNKYKRAIEKMAKESGAMQDFIAGVDPTGVRTFRNALNNEKNHKKHKLMGDLGGFAGGALAGVAMPAALTGAASLALKKKMPGLSKDLGYMAKGSLDALNPKKVVRYAKALPELSKFQGAGSDLMKKSNSVMGKVGDAERKFNAFKSGHLSPSEVRTMAQGGGVKKSIQELADLRAANDKVQSIGANLSKNYFNGAQVSEGAQRGMTALTTLGTAAAGGALNASSAHLQYNTARNTKKMLDEQQQK